MFCSSFLHIKSETVKKNRLSEGFSFAYEAQSVRDWNEEKLHWQDISRNGSVPPFSLLKNVRNCCKRPVLIVTSRPLTSEIIDIVKAPFPSLRNLESGRCDGKTERFPNETETFGLNSEIP